MSGSLIWSLISKFVHTKREEILAKHKNVSDLSDELERVNLANDLLTKELVVSRYKASQYFDLIVELEKQRDDWNARFKEHAGQHLAAQSILQDHLTLARKLALRAVEEINRYRKKHEEPEMKDPFSLLDFPMGTPEQFAFNMKELRDGAKQDINAKAERDRITKEMDALL
jgi:hypothetical protein